MKKEILIIVLLIAGASVYMYSNVKKSDQGGTDVPNSSVVSEMITVDFPKPNTVVTSPLIVTGRARGNWFFEASFPVSLVNWDGLIIAQGIATAKGDWMTTEFVPFEAVLEFEKPDLYPERGALILQKDNPSGLPQYDAAIEISVRFE